MMKKGNKIVTVMMLGMLFLLSSCGSKRYKLQEKYVNVFKENVHYKFLEDSTYAVTYDDGDDPKPGTYLFGEGSENALKLFDDETARGYEFIGGVYEDYLCIIWNGRLPKKYEDTKISRVSDDLEGRMYMNCYFHEDGTYEFLMYLENYDTKIPEFYHSQEGTYEVEKEKVVCTSDDGSKNIAASTYFMANDKIYSICFVAE